MSRRVNSIVPTVVDNETKLPLESTDMEAAINAFLRNCRVRNLTKETLKYYKIVLRSLTELLDEQGVSRPIDVSSDHIDECILMRQESGISDTTVNTFLRGWRAFFNWMHTEGHITEDVGARIRLIKAEKRVIQTFTKDQLRRLFEAPDKSTFTGYRNYVATLVLLETMCRISELINIKITDINWRDRTIKVYGKGRKERLVPFQAKVERHLQEYVNIRGHLDHDFLFVNIDNNPISKRTMQQEIAALGKEAGIKGVRCSPHTFRHTGAKMYIMAGGDTFSLQKILGHTSLDVVRMYVNLFSTDISAQHAKFSPLNNFDEGGV